MQNQEAQECADGGFEGHEGAEGRGGEVAQRVHLEREWQDGQQDRQAGRGRQDGRGEMPRGLRDAEECSGGRGDGHREGKAGDAAEAPADLLSEQDVRAPADSGDPGERDAGEVDESAPGLGECQNAGQGAGRPGQRAAAVAAQGCDGERAEELDGDGGAQRDPGDRAEKRDGDQPSCDPEAEQCRQVLAADGA